MKVRDCISCKPSKSKFGKPRGKTRHKNGVCATCRAEERQRASVERMTQQWNNQNPGIREAWGSATAPRPNYSGRGA